MKLYVIRHGQTKCNKEKRYNCRLDEDINEIGIKQAEEASKIVKNLNIDLIICSPYKINVILDTDTYNECDDQFALSYLIKSQEKFNIEAITVAPYSHKTYRTVSVKEGQELSYNEILKICKWLNFDTTNKVFKGSMGYLQNGYTENNPAVNKIIEIALKKKKTYILAIGAITNVALAIKKEPKIINKIEIIWLGGNELGYKDNLEYNFRQDIQAVREVFESKGKTYSITL